MKFEKASINLNALGLFLIFFLERMEDRKKRLYSQNWERAMYTDTLSILQIEKRSGVELSDFGIVDLVLDRYKVHEKMDKTREALAKTSTRYDEEDFIVCSSLCTATASSRAFLWLHQSRHASCGEG